MTAILYPVAANAELALSRPLGRAARESEARRRAGEAVVFATDTVGPAFATREAALEAYGADWFAVGSAAAAYAALTTGMAVLDLAPDAREAAGLPASLPRAWAQLSS